VMYLDFENRAAFLQKDIAKMIQNFTEEERRLIEENLFILVDQEIGRVELNLSNEDHMAALLRQVAVHRAQLIVIDTKAQAFSLTNENDNSEAERTVIKPLKHIARETDAAILLVHHIGKSNETGDRAKLYAGRGDSATPAAARLVLNMDHLKDGSGRKVADHVVLTAAKVKGKPFDDVVFELDFPRRWFEAADIVLPDEQATQSAILALITRPMKRNEVIEAAHEAGLEVSDSTISRALKFGLATRKIKKGIKLGYYEPMPEPTPEQLTGDILDADEIDGDILDATEIDGEDDGGAIG
jgi:hypothetical protein